MGAPRVRNEESVVQGCATLIPRRSCPAETSARRALRGESAGLARGADAAATARPTVGATVGRAELRAARQPSTRMTASPVTRTSPAWFLATVSRVTMGLSSRTAVTVTVAVTVSPMRTGARNFSDCER